MRTGTAEAEPVIAVAVKVVMVDTEESGPGTVKIGLAWQMLDQIQQKFNL